MAYKGGNGGVIEGEYLKSIGENFQSRSHITRHYVSNNLQSTFFLVVIWAHWPN